MRKLLSRFSAAALSIALLASSANAGAPLQKARPADGSRVAMKAAAPKKMAKGLEMPQARQWQKGMNQFANFKNRPLGLSNFARKAAPAFAPGASEICGAMLYNEEWESAAYGIYSFTTSAPCATEEIFLDSNLEPNGGGAMTADGYVCVNYFSFWGYMFMYAYRYDTDWNLIAEDYPTDYTCLATDIAYDATTDNIYGCFYTENLDGFQFGVLDTDTWSSSCIALLDRSFYGMAAAADGSIYGISADGVLVKFNKEDGSYQEIASTGITTQYICSAAIDPRSGLMYYTPLDDNASSLYSIDVTTGACEKIYDFPGGAEISGLYVPAPAAVDNAPDIVTNLSVDFANGSLTGTVSFTAPTTLYDGSAPDANETLTYSITANGEEVATGTCAYGENVNAEVTVPQSGTYKFMVTTSNGETSPAAKISTFVGFDTPKAIETVELNYSSGVMMLTWTPAEESVNGGYLGNITYTVRLGDEIIAEALTACNYSYAVAEPQDFTVYQYSVCAVNNGLESAPTLSNAVSLGALLPPFEQEFYDEGTALAYTVLDENSDGRVWTWSGSSMTLNYTFEDELQQDDWLVTPAIKLEGGKYYEFYFLYSNNSTYYTERLEAGVGTAPTADAMEIIIEPFEFNDGMVHKATGGYLAPADGNYYFGIHGISDGNQYTIIISSVGVGEGILSTAPAAISDLSIVPASDGSATATINFTAPDKDIAGNALDELNGIDLYVDYQFVATIAAEPGAPVSYQYTGSISGYYVFELVPNNASGNGPSVSANAFLGINLPGSPASASVRDLGDGMVEITWTAPETDADGNPINPDWITYTITDGNDVIAEDIDGYSLSLQAVAAGEQDFVQYAVYAATSTGMNYTPTYTNMIACGTPWNTPFIETFADGSLAYPWMVETLAGYPSFGIATDEDFDGILSANNDNGFMYMSASGIDYSGALTSGLIFVTADAPVLTYYWYAIAEDDENVIDVNVICGDQKINVASHTCEEAAGWHRQLVDMSAYKNMTIQLQFVMTVKTYIYTMIDDIRLEDPLDYDLAVANISANATSVMAGSDVVINYEVSNQGALAAEGYTVSLYCDGDLVQTAEDLPTLESMARYSGSFTHSFNALKAGTYTFSINVNYAKDQDLTNNASADVTVVVKATNYPAPELSGSYVEGQGVVLNWEAPYLDTAPRTILEDFESEDYEPFAIEQAGPWTLRCYNESETYVMEGATWPHGGEAYGFILFNPVEAGMEEYISGYGGTGNFMAAVAHFSGPNDAWLISPALPGQAQTVTFMASSYSDNYGLEEIAAYYSTTDMEKDSFMPIEIGGYNDSGVPVDWAEYSLELPEGTKYFAIVSTSTDVWILMVDDINYVGYSDFGNLELLGYNVYRNGEKINDALVVDTTYVDTVNNDGTYQVTAVYAQGESPASNAIEVKPQGIADAYVTSTIRVVGHTIVVTGAKSVMITAADGKVMRSAKGQDNVETVVASGVYMIKTNDRIEKVIVK